MNKQCGWLVAAGIAAGLVFMPAVCAGDAPAAPATDMEPGATPPDGDIPGGPRPNGDNPDARPGGDRRRPDEEHMKKFREEFSKRMKEERAKRTEEKTDEEALAALEVHLSGLFTEKHQYAKEIFAALKEALEKSDYAAERKGKLLGLLKDLYIAHLEDNTPASLRDKMEAIMTDEEMSNEDRQKAMQELGRKIQESLGGGMRGMRGMGGPMMGGPRGGMGGMRGMRGPGNHRGGMRGMRGPGDQRGGMRGPRGPRDNGGNAAESPAKQINF